MLVGAVGRHGDRRAARVPALVPPQHRAAGRRAVDAAAQRSRSVVGRDAGQRAGASRSRGACSTRSICSTRWTSGTSSRRCCWRTTRAEIRARALRVAEAAGPALADRWLPGVERALKDPRQRRAHRRGVGAGGAARRRRGRRDAAVHHQERSRAGDRRRRGAGRQRAEPPTSTSRRRDAAADSRATRANRAPNGACRWRARSATCKNPAFRPLLVPLMYDAEPRRRAGRRSKAPARSAPATSCSCRRWSRCCATAA